MEIQINKPKRLISLVLGGALVLTGTVALPASALSEPEAIAYIGAYADAPDTAPVPTTDTYDDASVNGVNSNNLSDVNDRVASVASTDVSTDDEIQELVSFVRIERYADSESGTSTPNESDFDAIGAIEYGVLAETFSELLRKLRGELYDSADVNTLAEVQALIDLVNEELALDLIKDYDAGDDELTVEIFELAGITGVVSGNIDEMLVVFAAATSTASNTKSKVQALVNAEIARLAAMEIISRYDGDNEVPTVDDYDDAGVVGVTAGNLSSINALFEDISYANSNTLEEIQAVVDAELARVAALARIAAYTGATNAPVLQTYIDAGVLRVDANNVTAINVLVAAATSANSDTLAEIQDIVDDQAVAQLVLTNYTGAGTALTLAQYSAAGITGVTTANLSKVNIALAAATVDGSNTASEIQAIVDGLNAAAAYWTKRVSTTEAKLYAKNIVGAGKVQFFLNGKEIAWVNATDAADPKLRAANGSYYLVRTVALATGKNVLEIKAKGIQVKRVVYSR